MREGLTRAFWPALVVAAFCVPLFVGLGNLDLRGDEAGHSFSVDRILETGDWLIPKSSPHPNAPFLEKPPLKFWIVAAGIQAGLPHDEFGLRFWDPVFGGLAFLYVFAIGRRLDGPVCGAVAVLVLFVNRNLLFEHGLRDNAMEAPLLLSYCGGVFHYLKYSSAGDTRRRWWHAASIAAFFALGFMVKFVAALFLPLVLGMVSVLVERYRTRMLKDWRLWMGACLVALALIAPWFLYATARFGYAFWDMMFGIQVYTRLTSHLDPLHLHPWNFYLTEMYERWRDAGAFWLVAAGSVLLVVDTIRQRWAEGLLVLLWIAVPMTTISLGTSKLFHYAYPFLPPAGLAAGYFMSRTWSSLGPRLDTVLNAVRLRADFERSIPRTAAALQHPALRMPLLVVGAVAVGVFVWTLLIGRFGFQLGGVTIRNNHLLRPALLAVLALVLAGGLPLAGRVGFSIAMLALLPFSAYRTTLHDVGEGRLVFRPARDCILRVGSQADVKAGESRGLYVDADGVDYQTPFSHEYVYYFRHVSPWIRPRETPPSRLYRFLTDPAEQRPLLMTASRYHAVLRNLPGGAGKPTSVPRIVLRDDVLLVLPGPFAACEAEYIEASVTRAR